jgi:type VI secretion system protein ImpA
MHIELPELETVLAPLEGGIGTPLADDDFSSPLVQFRQDCRSAARYEKADDEEEQEKAEQKWAEAAERGIAILTDQWKNLDVAALLIQALARTNGVGGLHFGYRVVSGLLRQYWDELSSSWGGDYTTGLKTLSDLNSTLLAPLRREALADGSSGTVLFYQYLVTQKLSALSPEERDSQVSLGALTMKDVEQRVAQTGDAFYERLMADLSGAGTAIGDTVTFLSEKLKEAGQPYAVPATSSITELLEDIERVVKALLGDRLLMAAEQASGQAVGPEGAPSSPLGDANGPRSQPGRPASREDALRQLADIADSLEKLEQQSLVPVVIRYGIWLGKLDSRQFFAYFNHQGQQLLKILKPVLGDLSEGQGDDEEE